MLTAPEAFMAVANATAAVVQKAPPYVTYHVHAVFHAAGEGSVDRTVIVRSDDGISVVHDDASGKDVLRPPFPAPPTFDALAQFKLSGQISLSSGGGKDKRRDGDMRITNIRPLHYETGPSRADAVARNVKGYVVTYAPDATPALGHLHLERNALMKDSHWMRDVWYDPVTLVPTRVLWGGQSDFSLDARYTTVDGHWLLHSIDVAAIVHAPMWLGRMTIAIGGSYDGYAFSDVAPDPRLVPTPAPMASATPVAAAPPQ
ncbi:MAG: hypothetical protein M3169_04445 [Candidatus Eremiobacteraeota bacterium]|nr:hypothetical protein [Candidatus Eremiobacteraeota bacterium]